jgi:hypothetical protein
MKKKHFLQITLTISLATLPLTGCFEKSKDSVAPASVAKSPAVVSGGSAAVAPDDSLVETIVPGAGSTLAPTADALISRIEKGLAGPVGGTPVTRTAGNCKSAYGQIAANLNNAPNPMKANIGGPISLLIYSCCSDAKPVDYLVTASTTSFPAGSQASVTAAGIKILDNYLGGLATSGPQAAQVSQIFSNLTAQNAASPNITTTKAFVHACVAAVTYGATMTGF